MWFSSRKNKVGYRTDFGPNRVIFMFQKLKTDYNRVGSKFHIWNLLTFKLITPKRDVIGNGQYTTTNSIVKFGATLFHNKNHATKPHQQDNYIV